CHGVASKGVAGHVCHDEVLGFTGASWSGWIGKVEMWTVGGSITSDRQSALRKPCFDLLLGSEERADACCTCLRHRRAADVACTNQTHQPGKAVEGATLRACHAEYPVVKRSPV